MNGPDPPLDRPFHSPLLPLPFFPTHPRYNFDSTKPHFAPHDRKILKQGRGRLIDPGGVEGMFMIRKGTALGIIILALFLVAAAQPAIAQAGLTETHLLVESSPVTPWTAKAGDETQGNLKVFLCYSDPGANPLEGNIVVTITYPPATEDIQMREDDDTEVVFMPQQVFQGSQDEPECLSATVNFYIDLLKDFNEDPHTHRFDIEVTAEAEDDIGTYTVPGDESHSMDVQIDQPEDMGGPDDDDEETDTETDDNPPETEDSPAPGLAVFTVLSLALFAVFRRRE